MRAGRGCAWMQGWQGHAQVGRAGGAAQWYRRCAAAPTRSLPRGPPHRAIGQDEGAAARPVAGGQGGVHQAGAGGAGHHLDAAAAGGARRGAGGPAAGRDAGCLHHAAGRPAGGQLGGRGVRKGVSQPGPRAGAATCRLPRCVSSCQPVPSGCQGLKTGPDGPCAAIANPAATAACRRLARPLPRGRPAPLALGGVRSIHHARTAPALPRRARVCSGREVCVRGGAGGRCRELKAASEWQRAAGRCRGRK